MFHEEQRCYFSNENLTLKNSFSKVVEENQYSTHIHSGFEVIYLLGGSVTYGFEGKEIKLSKGDILITPPFRYHYLNVDNNVNYERLNILFYPEKFDFDLKLNGIVVFNDDSHIVYKIINQIKYYCDFANPDDYSFIFELKIKELCYALASNFSSGTEVNTLVYDKTVRNILEYINDNIYKNISIADIAKHCYLSEGHVNHVFKKQFKTSPINYIKMKKLSIAQKLLLSKVTPTEVAERLGYEDYSVFYRNYLRFYNKKPSDDYRK